MTLGSGEPSQEILMNERPGAPDYTTPPDPIGTDQSGIYQPGSPPSAYPTGRGAHPGRTAHGAYPEPVGPQPPWTFGSDDAPTTWLPQVQPQSGAPAWPAQQQPYRPSLIAPSYRPVPYAAEGQYGMGPSNPRPPRRRSSTVIILAIVVAVTVIGGLAGWLATPSTGSGSHNASPTGPASTAPLSTLTQDASTPSTAGPSSTVYVLPPEAVGFMLLPDSGVDKNFSSTLPSDLRARSTAGIYQSPTNPQKVLLLAGAQGAGVATKAGVTTAFQGFTDSSGAKFGKPRTFQAGPMGGVMECGSGTVARLGSAPVSVCVVGDSHGVIIAMYTYRTTSSAASATRTLRPSFEHINGP